MALQSLWNQANSVKPSAFYRKRYVGQQNNRERKVENIILDWWFVNYMTNHMYRIQKKTENVKERQKMVTKDILRSNGKVSLDPLRSNTYIPGNLVCF